MTENEPLAHQSIADALEALRVQKAAVPWRNIRGMRNNRIAHG